MMMQPIRSPHPHDVLCGKGRGGDKHVGTIRWRQLIFDRCLEYHNLPAEHKTALSRSIVYAVRTLVPPGRFLIRDAASNTWIDIGEKKAREKTAQALRATRRKRLAKCESEPSLSRTCEQHIEMQGASVQHEESAGFKMQAVMHGMPLFNPLGAPQNSFHPVSSSSIQYTPPGPFPAVDHSRRWSPFERDKEISDDDGMVEPYAIDLETLQPVENSTLSHDSNVEKNIIKSVLDSMIDIIVSENQSNLQSLEVEPLNLASKDESSCLYPRRGGVIDGFFSGETSSTNIYYSQEVRACSSPGPLLSESRGTDPICCFGVLPEEPSFDTAVVEPYHLNYDVDRLGRSNRLFPADQKECLGKGDLSSGRLRSLSWDADLTDNVACSQGETFSSFGP